jgi:hypothetical protein
MGVVRLGSLFGLVDTLIHAYMPLIHTYMRTYTLVPIPAYIHVHAHTHTYIRVSVPCASGHAATGIHTYIHTYIQTHTYIP